MCIVHKPIIKSKQDFIDEAAELWEQTEDNEIFYGKLEVMMNEKEVPYMSVKKANDFYETLCDIETKSDLKILLNTFLNFSKSCLI